MGEDKRKFQGKKLKVVDMEGKRFCCEKMKHRMTCLAFPKKYANSNKK